jgi:hypothetical protein
MAKSIYRENYRLLIRAVQNRKTGVRDRAEPIIDEDDMRAAEKVFWKKRGFDSPPGLGLTWQKRNGAY